MKSYVNARVRWPGLASQMWKNQTSTLEVKWKVFSLRYVKFFLALVILAAGGYCYVLVRNWLAGVRLRAAERPAAVHALADSGALLSAADGTVTVMEGNNAWAAASPNQPLTRAKVVQTGPESTAVIQFAKGETCRLHPSTVVEITAMTKSSAAVRLVSGAIKVMTRDAVPGSRFKVEAAGRFALLPPHAELVASADPRASQYQMVVSKGSADFDAGDSVLPLAELQGVRFRGEEKELLRITLPSPPILILPANKTLIYTSGPKQVVTLEWNAAENGGKYHLRLARNPYFSAPLIDSRIASNEVRTNGLPEGMYYWLVQRIDNTGHESLEDDPEQFRIVALAQNEAELGLRVESISQVGRAVRAQGRTEPGSTLMINAETVPLSESGQFSYTTPPLLPGKITLTITSQDRSGRAVTRQQSFSVQ